MERGAADIGVVGRDTILEEDRHIYEVLDLNIGKCRMCVAGPESAKELLIQRGYDPAYGARPLKRCIQSTAETLIAKEILGGGLAGVAAAVFGVVNNAPGTASPIPGLLAPFAFNEPLNVVLAFAFAIAGGCFAGLLGGWIFGQKDKKMPSAVNVRVSAPMNTN